LALPPRDPGPRYCPGADGEPRTPSVHARADAPPLPPECRDAQRAHRAARPHALVVAAATGLPRCTAHRAAAADTFSTGGAAPVAPGGPGSHDRRVHPHRLGPV